MEAGWRERDAGRDEERMKERAGGGGGVDRKIRETNRPLDKDRWREH